MRHLDLLPVRLVGERPPGWLAKQIGKDVLLGCESINLRTVRRVKSCVPVSVECVDQDKDADKNVDADQTSTGRVVSGQSTGLFTQCKHNTSNTAKFYEKMATMKTMATVKAMSKGCLLLKVKRPVPMRSMIKGFTKNSVLQIDQGNLRSRLA